MSLRPRLAATLLFVTLAAHGQEAANNSVPKRSALDRALFYQLLLGEMSARGEDPGSGFALILDAARRTNDARLYQRAVEIALQGRAGDSALQAARAWKQAQPNSVEANRHVLQILLALNKVSDAVEPLKREVALAPASQRAAVIAALPRYFARVANKKQAASVLEQALADYLGSQAVGVAAWSAVGRLRLDGGDAVGALEAARRAQAIDAHAEGGALLALALLNPARPQADAMVRKYLEGPTARLEVRMEYARQLLDAQRYADAGQQLRLITGQRPELAEAWLLQGMLEMQEGRPDAAEASLRQYLTLAEPAASKGEQARGLVQAYLTLSHLAQRRKDLPQAEAWLTRITNPQDLLRAQRQRASILAQQGRMAQARALLRELPARNAAEARTRLNAEVQLLREHKLYQEAYDLLAQDAQRQAPDHELLYDQATLAEKLGRPDEMEQLLRRSIEIKPDYHHAYNALGYALAERGVRLTEARQLIVKALELAPGDPFITDSLGWVEFRLGNSGEALRLLRQAYKERPDAEIAAHLGEVLWHMEQREQARAIWREGLLLNAENETLSETLRRLGVTP